jgi:hypothetical protein
MIVHSPSALKCTNPFAHHLIKADSDQQILEHQSSKDLLIL